MRFSIITPAYVYDQDRLDKFRLCLDSLNKQTYDHEDFQHIVINDGSPLDLPVPNYPFLRIINEPNLQRMTAYNRGFKEAEGEIFCVLDADDEYEPDYLEKVDSYFKSFPEYKMFNFGCTMIHRDGATNLRGVFKPKETEIGHEIFGGGNIVNGTFVFHRSVYDELGAFPMHVIHNIDCTVLNYPAYNGQPEPFIRDLQMTSPYDFSAFAQLEFPELQKMYSVKHPDHPKLLVRELGNPFGQDYYLFYKYTRTYKSKPMDDFLLRVHLK